MHEPLEFFLTKNRINTERIKRIGAGEKYVAIELSDGNIGVCSTLYHPVDANFKVFENPDTDNIQHRIMLNAWLNAELNNRMGIHDGEGDIFDVVDFTKYRNIVMVGYFTASGKKIQRGKNYAEGFR
ncbi:MAG: DUF4213 domain-containing protein [Sphingobacterium sp.]|nr:DUF4213 domain-containing protein [Sphingobacterium sp.]